MSTDFSSLLQTREVAWPVPVHQPGTVSCGGTEFFSGRSCGQGYFLHGGTKLITPWPTENASVPTASVYSARQLRGLQLDFTALGPGARFQGDTDCIVVGDKDSALQICISQFSPNSLSAKYVHCPFTISGDCLNDRSWLSSSGWATQLTAYTRHATVHSSRSNLSAIAVADMTPPVAHDLNAAGMLLAFNTSLSETTTLGNLVSAAGQFVSFVANSLALSETSSPTAAQSVTKLHNLLAMPLYYFQPTFMSPYTHVPSPDRVLDGLPTDQDLYTTASMSTVYFGLRIEPWTMWTYTAGMALVLTTCLVVLVLGSLPRCAAGIPETTPWGFLDVAGKCYVDFAGAKPDEPAERTYHAAEQSSAALDQTASTDGWRRTGQSLEGARVKLRG